MDTLPVRNKAATLMQTVVLVGIMLGFVGLLGLIIAGIDGVIVSLVTGAMLLFFYPSLDAETIAGFFGAKPLPKARTEILYSYLDELKKRAGLLQTPRLYLLESPVMTAFTVGRPDNAVIILSSAMINRLDLPELVGVMAHEVAHIAHHDLWLMSLTDIITRMTALLSVMGQLIVLFMLPFYFMSDIQIPWLGIAILIIAPLASTLLQLTLSRAREYNADVGAAYLTGETGHLASALAKIDYTEQGLLERLLRPSNRENVPSLFRTHPSTQERIERLSEIRLPHGIKPLEYGIAHQENLRYTDIQATRSLLRYLLGHWH